MTERTDLHPVERTYRRALGAVRGTVRHWTPRRRPNLDDCRDAVGDALTAAIAGGWAARKGAWWYVRHKALRALRGWQRVKGGKVYSARSGATPAATQGMRLHGAEVDPATWIDAELAGPIPIEIRAEAEGLDLVAPESIAAVRPRPELPLATWEREGYVPPAVAARTAPDIRVPAGLVLVALGKVGSVADLAEAVGVTPETVRSWRRRQTKPSAEMVERLRRALGDKAT